MKKVEQPKNKSVSSNETSAATANITQKNNKTAKASGKTKKDKVEII